MTLAMIVMFVKDGSGAGAGSSGNGGGAGGGAGEGRFQDQSSAAEEMKRTAVSEIDLAVEIFEGGAAYCSVARGALVSHSLPYSIFRYLLICWNSLTEFVTWFEGESACCVSWLWRYWTSASACSGCV